MGDRFSFLLPMTRHNTKRWSKQDRSGLNPFCSSESMSFDSNQLVAKSAIEDFTEGFKDCTLESNTPIVSRVSRIRHIWFQDGMD